MSLIKDSRGRQVTFHKRKNGLIKKLRELAALTGADIYCEIKFGKRLIRVGQPITSSAVNIQELPITFDSSKKSTDVISINENSSSSSSSTSSSSSCKLIDCPVSSPESKQEEVHQQPREELPDEPLVYTFIPPVEQEDSAVFYAASYQTHLEPVTWVQPISSNDGVNFDIDSLLQDMTASGNFNNAIYMNDVSDNNNFNNYYK